MQKHKFLPCKKLFSSDFSVFLRFRIFFPTSRGLTLKLKELERAREEEEKKEQAKKPTPTSREITKLRPSTPCYPPSHYVFTLLVKEQ